VRFGVDLCGDAEPPPNTPPIKADRLDPAIAPPALSTVQPKGLDGTALGRSNEAPPDDNLPITASSTSLASRLCAGARLHHHSSLHRRRIGTAAARRAPARVAFGGGPSSGSPAENPVHQISGHAPSTDQHTRQRLTFATTPGHSQKLQSDRVLLQSTSPLQPR